MYIEICELDIKFFWFLYGWVSDGIVVFSLVYLEILWVLVVIFLVILIYFYFREIISEIIWKIL